MAPSSLRSWWHSLQRSQRPSDDAEYHLDPAEAKKQIDRIPRFRVLVMGRANAGKTTILQRLCNTTDRPEIFNGKGEKVNTRDVEGSQARGYHNIENELWFKSNPRFVFHDSCGFEAGSEAEFEKMKKFVTDQAKSTKLEDRIHAIWYCIPLNERNRMVTAAERKFFNECDSGHVPVIVLLTKADTLNLDAVEELMERELTEDDAIKLAPEVEKQLQEDCQEKVKGWLNELKFPPQKYLILTGMEKENGDCKELLRSTANTLTEEGLQGLLISSQQSNLGLCMEFAIMKTLKRYMNRGGDQKSLTGRLAAWFPFESLPKYKKPLCPPCCLLLCCYCPPLCLLLPCLYCPCCLLKPLKKLDKLCEDDPVPPPPAEELRELDDRMDHNLVPPIKHGSSLNSIPTLSMSRQPSMMALAEHGIGCVIVFEYLFFQLQVKGGGTTRMDVKQNLKVIVREYKKSGVQHTVIAHIAEAFQQHGESVDALCPMLVDIAQANQMSKKFLT